MADAQPWYVQQSPELGQAFNDFLEAVNEKGVLDEKTRELLMAALASAFRCRYCTEAHVKAALEAGATKAEVAEAILIAALEGAGTQLAWCKDIYREHLGGD